MPRCPFCKEFSYGETGPFTCSCGEALPEMVHNYRRERCICGKTVSFQPVELDLSQIFPAAF